MAKRSDYQKAMRHRYPAYYFTDREKAERYKAETDEKGMGYVIHEHKGAFIVDEPKKGLHPYWHPIKQDPEPKHRWYDEQGREI